MNQLNEKVLSLQNLSMRYANKDVLAGVILDVFRGQIIGYIRMAQADLYENLTAYKYLLFMDELYGREIQEISEKARRRLMQQF